MNRRTRIPVLIVTARLCTGGTAVAEPIISYTRPDGGVSQACSTAGVLTDPTYWFAAAFGDFV